MLKFISRCVAFLLPLSPPSLLAQPHLKCHSVTAEEDSARTDGGDPLICGEISGKCAREEGAPPNSCMPRAAHTHEPEAK